MPVACTETKPILWTPVSRVLMSSPHVCTQIKAWTPFLSNSAGCWWSFWFSVILFFNFFSFLSLLFWLPQHLSPFLSFRLDFIIHGTSMSGLSGCPAIASPEGSTWVKKECAYSLCLYSYCPQLTSGFAVISNCSLLFWWFGWHSNHPWWQWHVSHGWFCTKDEETGLHAQWF